MNPQRLEIVFQPDSIADHEVASSFLSLLNANNALPEKIELSGTTCSPDEAQTAIERTSKRHFKLQIGPVVIDFSTLTNHRQILIQIDQINSEVALAPSEWLNPLIAHDGFVQAWLVDKEYNFWQNAKDPLEYKVKGKSMAGLPMVPNGLPPPLDMQIIDTSANPGRRIIRRGYIEAIGCPMWLGEPFWALVGTSKEQIFVNSDWLHPASMNERVIEIQPLLRPFIDSSTAELQNKLRAVLYQRCRSQPGDSGAIGGRQL